MSTLAPIMARPSKRTPEREARIIEAIRAGATRKVAALHAGIHEVTLCHWLKNANFANAIARAEADLELRLNAIILQAAITDAKHAEWWLERRRWAEYGVRSRVELDVRHYAERVAGELGLNVDELLAEAERIVRQGRD